MLYDVFIYNNEEELLDIRYNEVSLCKEPTFFVAVEANVTHTGEPKKVKPIQRSRFLHYIVKDMPVGATPIEMEIFQRNKISEALKVLSPKDTDIIVLSDVDEVPRARQLNLFKPEIEFSALILDKYGYFLNWIESEQSWDRARIMNYKYFKEREPEKIRNSGYDFSLHHAGWHWSYLWNRAKDKIHWFSHQELNTKENEEKIAALENFWSKDELRRIDIDLSHPEYLLNYQYKFKHIIDETI